MKYSHNFDRDWLFYLLNMKKFRFSGVPLIKFEFNKDGYNGKKAFHIYDSTGKIVITKHPRLTSLIVNCKKSINFHIKMWVDGYNDPIIGIDEYLKEFIGEVPIWIRESFAKQLYKR